MNVEELKKEKSYSFECDITEEYKEYTDHDEWGCAFIWLEDKNIGVEYDFSFDDGESHCAIYKNEMGYDGYLETDTCIFIKYDINFDSNNWKEELENAMCEAFIEFFKGEKLDIDKRVECLLKEIEKLGYNVQHEYEDTYLISKFSPCGQDCNASIDTENDADSFVYNIGEYARDFDVSYNTYLWLDNTGHGTNGAPYDMKDVYEDMEWWRDSLEELADELERVLYIRKAF